MNLLDILSPDCIKAPLVATDKQAVIRELVELLGKAGKVPDTKPLNDAVWQRECTKTTGIGLGLAIPHGKCAGMANLAMAIGRPASPMDFGSIDGQPVRLVVLLASPPDKTNDHIQALARVSRMILVESFREKIYAAASAEEIFALVKSQERPG
ncbi:MAG: PTS sugar transporter subunit IIA [Phycisphaeraceae bacterium]|nr:MAG: PTS sugar transporter subunit IIA [Phycisphaeraceae bacterium]